MSIFKCKMCGGDLEVRQDQTVAVCDYCGTKQTLPRLDGDRKANLYDRANHFRRNNDFDKAMGIYEQILNEDNTDAEAYWSLVLCRYGIEYVEDPTTHKRIPTVNRAQYTSVFADEDYKSALKYADVVQREVYEAEAKAIDEIQKGILAISQKEEPFDVFICYKETDNAGRRTPDSVLANDLYHQLTQEGFKVFFARITLEDKLGSAYEPYIFAALNSAKVMVVLGTKPEYFNAVWVKNEWSRYLSLIKNGAKKTLVPAYKDMDPYDLPEEFSHLQAQDMSKLGFMQDLLRGIRKIAAPEEAQPVKETVVVQQSTASGNVTALLKRAFMFLEDQDWSSANEYCEKVLDMDPECARAYLGKLMAELRVRTQNSLRNCPQPFDGKNNYQKVMRFADTDLKSELTGYIEHIVTRNENARLEGIYSSAKKAMDVATTEKAYKDAAEQFETIPEYQDAAVLAKECREKAEIARKNAILSDGLAKMKINTEPFYEAAIQLFESIPGWKDADENVRICQTRIEEIRAKQEAERLEQERQAELARQEEERIAKRTRKITIITTAVVCVAVAIALLITQVVIPNSKYNKAVAMIDAGKYAEAIDAFRGLDGYKDSEYYIAVAWMESKKYVEAIAMFESLGDYKDSTDKISECEVALLEQKYNNAISKINAGNYIEAISEFKALDGYKDSDDQIKNAENAMIYDNGVKLFNENRWDIALESFNTVGDYKDSIEYTEIILEFEEAIVLMETSVADAEDILVSLEYLDNDRVNELLEIVNTYKPYCREYEWIDTDGNSAFPFESNVFYKDGIIYWSCDDGGEPLPSFTVQRGNPDFSNDEYTFLQSPLQVDDMTALEEIENDMYYASISFEDGEIDVTLGSYSAYITTSGELVIEDKKTKLFKVSTIDKSVIY